MIAVGKVRMKMVYVLVALNFKTDEVRKYVDKLLNSDMFRFQSCQ